MRVPIWLTILVALIGLILMLLIGQVFINPDIPLLLSAQFDTDVISPNADGAQDITRFSYELSRNALVSMSFIHEDGTEYRFREQQARASGEYEVLFSGVVDGFWLPDEDGVGTIERRLLPNGDYRWRLHAEGTEREEQEEIVGTLTINDVDSTLPIISVFTVGPEIFSPNQDGIDDRVEINVYLEKEADLKVFLISAVGEEIPISARKEGRQPGEAGRHVFDYEAGIDLGADPPPDGTYTIVVEAQDAEGQRLRRDATLTIETGGKPLAEIVPQAVGVDVVFAVQHYDDDFFTDRDQMGEAVALPNNPADLALTALTIPVGDMLVFKLTVENYSDVPIRTTGPPPGTVYQQNQLAATLGWIDESGAWRVGIECQTSMTSYPWRWALGTDEELEEAIDVDNGNVYRYLPAGKSVVVWGAVRMTEIEARNPQDCWAGLIHEDVEVSLRNNNVGRRAVELVDSSSRVGE